MLLRALAGPYAGSVRDYSPQAAFGALRTGMAERPDAPAVPVASLVAAETTIAESLRPVTQKARSGRRA